MDYTATCRTPGCVNEGVVVPMTYTDEDGPPAAVVCGPCGQPITETEGLPT